MKWIISALFLLLVSCTREEIDVKPEPITTTFRGNLTIIERVYINPGIDSETGFVYDTIYAQVIVKVDSDSIHFISNNANIRRHSALITDSVGNGHYRVGTYRPICHYAFVGDSLIYYSSAWDPTGGPWFKKDNFTGLKM